MKVIPFNLHLDLMRSRIIIYNALNPKAQGQIRG